MAYLVNLEPNSTYATRDNAIKAVEKKFGPNDLLFGSSELHYMIVQHSNGRYFPVFLGERAIFAGVHLHFRVAN